MALHISMHRRSRSNGVKLKVQKELAEVKETGEAVTEWEEVKGADSSSIHPIFTTLADLHVSDIQLLSMIQELPDINIVHPTTGRNLLMELFHTRRSVSRKSIRFLVAMGIDLSHQDVQGYNILFYAKDDNFIITLIEYGAPVDNRKTLDVLIPLFIRTNFFFMMRLLANAGAMPSVDDVRLCDTQETRHTIACLTLLSTGADTSALVQFPVTPLTVKDLDDIFARLSTGTPSVYHQRLSVYQRLLNIQGKQDVLLISEYLKDPKNQQLLATFDSFRFPSNFHPFPWLHRLPPSQFKMFIRLFSPDNSHSCNFLYPLFVLTAAKRSDLLYLFYPSNFIEWLNLYRLGGAPPEIARAMTAVIQWRSEESDQTSAILEDLKSLMLDIENDILNHVLAMAPFDNDNIMPNFQLEQDNRLEQIFAKCTNPNMASPFAPFIDEWNRPVSDSLKEQRDFINNQPKDGTLRYTRFMESVQEDVNRRAGEAPEKVSPLRDQIMSRLFSHVEQRLIQRYRVLYILIHFVFTEPNYSSEDPFAIFNRNWD